MFLECSEFSGIMREAEASEAPPRRSGPRHLAEFRPAGFLENSLRVLATVQPTYFDYPDELYCAKKINGQLPPAEKLTKLFFFSRLVLKIINKEGSLKTASI